MTFKQALEAGYKIGDWKYHRGYVSRKLTNLGELEVFVAGGNRRNELYVLLPCFSSTRYCYRQYLYK